MKFQGFSKWRAMRTNIDEDAPRKLSSEAILQTFEPENPSFVATRLLGLGWDLNLGALAAKAGAIRPDDSLPDLETYVPTSMRTVLKVGPWVGLAATAAVAAKLYKHEKVVSNWSLTGKPRSYSSGRTIAATLLGTAAAPMVLLSIRKMREGASLEEAWNPHESASLVASAQTMGLQAMAVLGGVASLREVDRPGEAQPLAIAAVLAAPVVAGSLLVLTTKTALHSLSDALHTQDEQDGMDEQ